MTPFHSDARPTRRWLGEIGVGISRGVAGVVKSLRPGSSAFPQLLTHLRTIPLSVRRAGLVIGTVLFMFGGPSAAHSQALHDSVRVDVAGTQLYLDLRGPADPAAVLLFLHGGPAQGVMGLLAVEAYPGPLIEQRYAVAYLQQRGVLRSPAVPDSTQTLATHIDDVNHVVAYLHRRFPRSALVIAGHSWGGLLATAYAERHPEAPVAGLVLIAAPVSFVHNEQASYDSALAWATRVQNDTALEELRRVGRPPHASLAEINAYRKWTARALPMTTFEPNMSKVLGAGGFTAADASWQSTSYRIAVKMLPALVQSDLRAGLPRVRWPLLAMAGGHDAIVLPAPMFEDLRTYGGPKRFVTFASSDHFLFMEEPERFASEVSRFIAELSGSR